MLTKYQKRKIDMIALILAIAVSLSLTIAMDGCAAHTRATPETPSGPVTPFQQVLVDNDILANTNLSVAQAVISERDLGNIPKPVAHDILAVQDRIARLDKHLSQILAQGPDIAKVNSASIVSLLNQISGLAKDPALEGVGSADVKSKMAAVLSSVGNILSSLHAAGVVN